LTIDDSGTAVAKLVDSRGTMADDKFRYKSITETVKIRAEPNFCINFILDETNSILTKDSGISVAMKERVNDLCISSLMANIATCQSPKQRR